MKKRDNIIISIVIFAISLVIMQIILVPYLLKYFCVSLAEEIGYNPPVSCLIMVYVVIPVAISIIITAILLFLLNKFIIKNGKSKNSNRNF